LVLLLLRWLVLLLLWWLLLLLLRRLVLLLLRWLVLLLVVVAVPELQVQQEKVEGVGSFHEC
jgi:hypothetical protein